MKKWTISRLDSSDLEGLECLVTQLGYPSDAQSILKRLEHLRSLENHGLFKISQDGVIQGWIHLEKVFDLIEETKVEIKAIVVDEKYRSEGHGKSLIEYAKKWALEQGLNTIYLNCNILRHRSHEFYKREGFTLIRTSHFFELKL